MAPATGRRPRRDGDRNMEARHIASSSVGIRSSLREIALPTEHGGWALTLEPALLALLVAPSLAGTALAAAAFLAFLIRTPAKTILVDRWRARRLARTRLAARVVGFELMLLLALIVTVTLLADDRWWWVPGAVALPLLGVELWYDMRSRSRRLIPELLGAVAVAGTAAMITLADGQSRLLAIGLWVVLGGRVLTSIPHVRAQIQKMHNRSTSSLSTLVTDLGALGAVALAPVLDGRLVLGAAAVFFLIVLHRATAGRAVSRVTILGIQQTILGLAVVTATATGVLAGWP